MSKVFISTRYCKTGKPVGGGFTEYISKRDGVDKTINTRYRSDVFTQYAAERPGVVKMGEHGLFGQEDYVNLHKASQEIYHHKGIVWEEIISLRQTDAERLGYDTPDAWRNLLRSKQFEIASYHRIPAENMKWYAAFHKEQGHYHVHFLVYNKEPGGEFICPRDYERYKESLTKTIFKDEMQQLYIERYDLKVKNLKVQRQIFCQSEKELTKAEYERLLKAAKSKKNERLYLIMQTICATGIRVSELKYINVNSVMTGQAQVRLKGKIRMIILPKELCQLLKKYIKERHITSGSVFVTRKAQPVDRHSIWKSMKQLCETAGVSKEKVFPHNLRHLFARTYYSLQKDIVRLADILGHSNVNTTRIYTIENGSTHRRQMQRMGLVRMQN